jgi:hypothetical protein
VRQNALYIVDIERDLRSGWRFRRMYSVSHQNDLFRATIIL